MRQEAQRFTEPEGSARRGPLGGTLTGLAQRGDRRRVALFGRVLEMVRPLRRRGPAGGEHVSATGVRTESPTRRRRLVDRSPHQRVTEPEPARHLSAPNKIEA